MDGPSSDRAMPKRGSLTRIALILTCLLLGVTLVTWVASEFRLFTAARAYGDITQRGADQWVYSAHSLRFTIFNGRVAFVQSEYQSVNSDREAATRFAEQRPVGWGATTVPRGEVGISDHRNVYWISAADFGFFGLGATTTLRNGEESRVIGVPHWLLAMLFAGGSFALWFPSHRRARRAAKGLCPRCGYEVRGLGAALPCPECGRPQQPGTRT